MVRSLQAKKWWRVFHRVPSSLFVAVCETRVRDLGSFLLSWACGLGVHISSHRAEQKSGSCRRVLDGLRTRGREGSVPGRPVLVDMARPRELAQLPGSRFPGEGGHTSWSPSGCNRSHTALCCPSSALCWAVWSGPGGGRQAVA